jgi:enterochelin esterase-like enzyme
MRTIRPMFHLARRLAVWSLSLAAFWPEAVAQASRDLDWRTVAIAAPGVSYHEFQSEAADLSVSYHLYTPPGYVSEGQRRFPVVYWLHGSGGGLSGIEPLAREFDAAIRSGEAPPFLAVFVNGLRFGMYVDWKDGRAPLESVIVRDLVPHIDGAYRTVSSCRGRMLDGFSMGGMGPPGLGSSFRRRSATSLSSAPVLCRPPLIEHPGRAAFRPAICFAMSMGATPVTSRRSAPDGWLKTTQL